MASDWQPTLTGRLLELRPLRDDDRHELYALASDPLIWEQHPDRERWREERFRVVFSAGVDNLRSRRAIEKLGAVPAGSRKNTNGGESVVYHLTAASYRGPGR
jgi:RimJ/RimL family protein N-acetyltransferase